MTWFIDEYLDKTIRNLDLCPGIEIHIASDSSLNGVAIRFAVYWSHPRLNLDWYPLISVDANNDTVFFCEGSENPEEWQRHLNDAADAIEKSLSGRL